MKPRIILDKDMERELKKEYFFVFAGISLIIASIAIAGATKKEA